MITEDYVSYEVAKLLEEKGFEQHETKLAYDKNGKLRWSDALDPFEFSAPTHQTAMKWLRIKYNIFISIAAFYEEDQYLIGYIPDVWRLVEGHYRTVNALCLRPIYGFDKYEAAVEETLKYVLNNLIDEHETLRRKISAICSQYFASEINPIVCDKGNSMLTIGHDEAMGLSELELPQVTEIFQDYEGILWLKLYGENEPREIDDLSVSDLKDILEWMEENL